MKRTYLFPVLLFMAVFGITSCTSYRHTQADLDTQQWRYEIEPVAVGTQGTYLIKVWSYSRSSRVAIEQAKKNAVHGIVFRGFSGVYGVPGQRPLTPNPNLEQEQAHFFNNFFATGGKYQKFVSVSGDGTVQPRDRLRVGNEYKIGVVVSVNVAELRKDLEAAGIIRALDAGF